MTILDVWLTAETALVGVDTVTVRTDGSRHHGSKLLPLVHAARLHMNTMDFDAAVDVLPSMLPIAFNDFLAGASNSGIPDTPEFDRNTVVIVGWSRRKDHMVGWQYNQENRASGFAVKAINPYSIAPWDVSLEKYPDPKTMRDMERLARAQHRLLLEKEPAAACGGSFIVACLGRNGMQISTVCDL